MTDLEAMDSLFDFIEVPPGAAPTITNVCLTTRDEPDGLTEYSARLSSLANDLLLSVSQVTHRHLSDLTRESLIAISEDRKALEEKTRFEVKALSRVARLIGFGDSEVEIPTSADRLNYEPLAETASTAVFETLMTTIGTSVSNSEELARRALSLLKADDFVSSSGGFGADIEWSLETASRSLFNSLEEKEMGQSVPLFYRDCWAHAKMGGEGLTVVPTVPALLFPYADHEGSPGVDPRDDEFPFAVGGTIEMVPIGGSMSVYRDGTTLSLKPDNREVLIEFDLCAAVDPIVKDHSLIVECSVKQPILSEGVVVRKTSAGWLAEWHVANGGGLFEGTEWGTVGGEIDCPLNIERIAHYISDESVD